MRRGLLKIVGVAALAVIIAPVFGCKSTSDTTGPSTNPTDYASKMKEHGQQSYGRPTTRSTPASGSGGAKMGGSPPGPGAASGK